MKTLKIEVAGIVQGVGFRPFLYREAFKHGLNGHCLNTGKGVEIVVCGKQECLDGFIADLNDRETLPPLSEIRNIEVFEHEDIAEEGFKIIESERNGHNTLIAPDLAMCDDCKRELFDPKDRRFHYPFINCTNCGPRFTIVKKVPYDRPYTSMENFPMCDDCAREYKDVLDRRYHAQPVACPKCGPEVELHIDNEVIKDNPIEKAIEQLSMGKIIAIKGLGGFHLACIIKEDVVERLRERKNRWGKPLAIMVKDDKAAEKYCQIKDEERKALMSHQRPIVLLDKNDSNGYQYLSKSDTIGIMCPYTPLHELLFATDEYDALVMTSANLSDDPVIYTNEDAYNYLGNICDGYLIHNRDILRRVDDSLVQVVDGRNVFYRRSRGYAPSPLQIEGDATGILALGAEQKASFAYGKNDDVFLSQHIGDLKNLTTYDHYVSQIKVFEELFDLNAKLLVCDKHPDYLSSRYGYQRAVEDNIEILPVQHHHAHMAACMADNHLNEDCIGLIFDGTGLGDDNTIWGSEVLYGGFEEVKRFASIKPIALAGGDLVTKEINRVGFALLKSADLLDKELNDENLLLSKMIDKKINSPLSSGMGRLFDGIYNLITGEVNAGYEGEAAIMLEVLANRSHLRDESYDVQWIEDGVKYYDYRLMLKEIKEDLDNHLAKEDIALKFHNTIVEYGVSSCLMVKELTGLDKVVLSGGTFFNRILSRKLNDRLSALGFKVYMHHRVSPGDEGLSFGQLHIAKAKLCK